MDLTMVYLFMTRTCFGFVGKNVGIGGSVGWIRTYVRTSSTTTTYTLCV